MATYDLSLLKEIGNIPIQSTAGADSEQLLVSGLSTVVHAFVDLQRAQHKADYDIGEPFGVVDAPMDVVQERPGICNLGGCIFRIRR